MAREVRSPYPADAIFAVRKGFKTGVYNDYRTFLAQTADYPGGKELWAVFTDREHAQTYVDSGICPVPPLDEKNAPGPVTIPSSLPTPDPSPDHENASSPLHAYHNATSSVQLGLSATQPPPAPRKPLVVQPEDSDGDTEPEEDFKPPSASLPAQGAARASQLPPRRPYKSGSITEALKRHASLNSGNTPITQVASPPKPEAHAAPSPFPLTAPVPSGSRSTQRVFPSPSKASGSGEAPAPKPTSTLAPTPRFAPISIPAPPLIPELQTRPRPRGEYEQCTHCSGHGWILTPAAQTAPIPPPETDIVQTPPRTRATPTTNLRILPNSEIENSSRSPVKKIQTPSGSRLRVSSVGGVGPERTLKRGWKRTVSDTEMARRSRVVSDGTQRKGKGKEKAVEIEVDESNSKSSPFTYDYM
ncbi:unnamed protein product [Rhizoctonia solani]|uniref:Ribonuclease H1 N-terminal domain-containing protein n=1 Tax=Rhizoctonia solani TaxID=456999 RepID=A0A8H3A222_9AGAM|nr:unnamed protein product [Rhizoctonia solani]